jgi:hypothetical protein
MNRLHEDSSLLAQVFGSGQDRRQPYRSRSRFLKSSNSSRGGPFSAQRLSGLFLIKMLRDTKRLRGSSGADRLPGREATAAFQRLSAAGAALRQPSCCEDRYANGGITRGQPPGGCTCNTTDSISDRRRFCHRFHCRFDSESQAAVHPPKLPYNQERSN